jgi:xanthine dehydrogenase molybdopterin binding subunit/xanthine dehydrogenase small subunit
MGRPTSRSIVITKIKSPVSTFLSIESTDRMQPCVLIYLNGKRIAIAGETAFSTLVEYLREQRGLVGTKIGCAEGDCGACTVLVGVPEDGTIRYRPSASCIRPLYQLDGTHIVTIEGLTPVGGQSPIQRAMIEHHGSQCGFCTPGFVVAMEAAFEHGAPADEDDLRTGLAGNLCRCTGYVPILDAGMSVAADRAERQPLSSLYPSREMYEELAARGSAPLRIEASQRVFFRPHRLEDAVAFRARHPDSIIVSGGTELGVQRNKRGLEPTTILSLAGLGELAKISRDGNVLSVGANVTWRQLQAFSRDTLPEIHALTLRFGSPQIRNVATLVGNIAHGSPVADSLCLLLIVGAQLELIGARGTRRVGIDGFYRGPKQTVLAADEFITWVLIPLPPRDEIVKLYKISKRKEMDVSTFRAAIRVARKGDTIGSAAIAYSGVGPTARRLPQTEAFLAGRPFSEATFREAGKRARAEVEPISDVRGSRDFRLQLAENVLLKFYDQVSELVRENGSSERNGSERLSQKVFVGCSVSTDPGCLTEFGVHRAPYETENVALRTTCLAYGSSGPSDPYTLAGQSIPHESAHAHVTGQAVYLDDIPPTRNELLVEFVGSPTAHARIVAIDMAEAARIEGIAGVFTAADVPGDNRFGPIFHDEELLAASEYHHIGQPIVALAGESRAALRAARAAIRIELEPLAPVLTIDEAIAGRHFIGPTRQIARGDATAALTQAEHVLEGTFRTGGQEHFYLETQAALAIPGESGQITVHSSTQNPSEIQDVVAHCLGLRQNQVVCICNRMGGGFGGKESQAAHPALLAALVAFRTGRPSRIVYPRHLDMRVTGKRHPYLSRYKVGFDSEGRIEALSLELYSDGGCAADLSLAVMERSMLHADNAYFIPNMAVSGTVCRTNLPSNTAMRGFGGPQGIAAIENIIEEIAAHLGLDAFLVRRRNCYVGAGRETTHYGQVVSNNRLPAVLDRLAETSDYVRRRDAAARFNAASLTHLRGLALTPVKFGISFTRRALNQGNALVNIYRDGTIQVSTGGTEMGQGLNTKIRQIVADAFALPLEAVRVMPTSTEKNNNTSPTAASASTDLNGTAALRACETLRDRLAETAALHLAAPADGIAASPAHVRFERGGVLDDRRPGIRIGFDALVRLAYEDRVDLGARGFYATPGVDFNRETGRGNPFLYFTNGAAVAEVEIDRLTGELAVTRVDILIDIGRSLNPAIDRGQVIGAFVQGMGWSTTEELLYSETGELLSNSPNNYKIPNVECMPRTLRVDFLENPENRMNLLGSKAVGEPPFVLGLSVWAAAKQAIASLTPGRAPPVNLPATSEELLKHLARYGEAVHSEKSMTVTPGSDEEVETEIHARAQF